MRRSNAERIVGLDVHPDSFAGAILEGRDPWKARVVSTSSRVALPHLEKWALRHTRESDWLVLEASGNAFAVAERLRGLKRKVVILDSHSAGKVGRTYCATDRLDAIKIARIYLSALSPLVWQPDQKTRERREVFSAYQAVVKEATRLKQQIKAMLNEHCVRLESGFRLSHPSAIGRLLQRRNWTEAQKMLLQQLHAGLVAARARRQQLRHYMAQEILAEKELLRLTRLCGISLITLYGLIATIGDIKRFVNARKLSAYLGLNPSVEQSGNYEGPTSLKRHGCGGCAPYSCNRPRNSCKWITRYKSGAWPLPCAAAATRQLWLWRANSAWPSGTSCKATSSARLNAWTPCTPNSTSWPPNSACRRSKSSDTKLKKPSSRKNSTSYEVTLDLTTCLHRRVRPYRLAFMLRDGP
jgi:transposase